MIVLRKEDPGDSAAIANVHIRSRRDAMPWLPERHTESETVWWIEDVVLTNQDVWVAANDDQIVGIHAARTFYERHGFQPIRYTDGTNNEEREPDVLYYRSLMKPILFVDIDGVLNTYGGECPAGYQEHDLFPEDDEPVRINPAASQMLARLATVFELVWGSGWTAEDRTVLPAVLDLPEFAGAAEMPPIPFDPVEKIPAIERVAGNRPLAWIDDLHTQAGIEWAAQRIEPTLLVHTDPAIGIMQDHVDQLLAWANTLTSKT